MPDRLTHSGLRFPQGTQGSHRPWPPSGPQPAGFSLAWSWHWRLGAGAGATLGMWEESCSKRLLSGHCAGLQHPSPSGRGSGQRGPCGAMPPTERSPAAWLRTFSAGPRPPPRLSSLRMGDRPWPGLACWPRQEEALGAGDACFMLQGEPLGMAGTPCLQQFRAGGSLPSPAVATLPHALPQRAPVTWEIPRPGPWRLLTLGAPTTSPPSVPTASPDLPQASLYSSLSWSSAH